MDVSPATLAKQISIEQRFNCVICLCARFEMVYGRCQHRICTRCAYGSSDVLRVEFQHCPSCQQEDVFPDKKPTVPEDNIELQKLLGVTACQNNGCKQEFWSWEKIEHDLNCPFKHSSRRTSPTTKENYRKSPTSTLKSKQVEDMPERTYPLRSKNNLWQRCRRSRKTATR